MKEIAPGVYHLSGFPPNYFNIYLLGDVLVDAGTRYSGRRIFRQIKGRTVRVHALTHAHPDHQGASREVCEALGIPLWCGEGDSDSMESGDINPLKLPDHWIVRFEQRWLMGPPYPVSRRLTEGDEVGEFRVLETPGHSPGHVAFWRESDRVLILGDVLLNMNLFTGKPGLHEPLKDFTPNPRQNRESARRMARLKPAVIGFGHGPVLYDGQRFLKFVQRLKD